MQVAFGIDIFLENAERYLKGKNFALFVNQSSVSREGKYLFEVLLQKGLTPKKIFVPEHGLFGTEQDQITIEDAVDTFTKIKTKSLYGQTLAELYPKDEDLVDIDTLVIDIQDIGVRYYTYAYTAAFLVRAASKFGIRVLVCDRPNPLGGIVVEGGLVAPSCFSFVGAYPLPVRHALTLGELLRYLNVCEKWNANLEVITLKNWQRKMLYNDTHGLWVQPSPNMPTFETNTVYAGTCLFEGTNVSEGRGTTRPFEIIGAPFIDPQTYAQALNALKLPGVYFRPLYFKPTFHKFKDEVCGGIFVHVTDVLRFESFYTGLEMVRVAQSLWPKEFLWRQEPYEYVTDVLAIDLLTGSDKFRLAIEKGGVLEKYREEYQKEERLFKEKSSSQWLYK